MNVSDAYEKAIEALVELLESEEEHIRLSAAQTIVNKPWTPSEFVAA